MKNMLVNEIITATAPHVLRSINAETGINWMKPFTIEKLTGNYTTRKIENMAAAAGYNNNDDLIILLTRDTANKWRTELNIVTIEAGKVNIDHDHCGSGSIYTNAGIYKSSPYSAFYRKADFEETRKKTTAETYIIMQKAADTSIKGGKHRDIIAANGRYKLIEEKKHGDGHGNTYTGAITLQRTYDHGSRIEYKANPGRYINVSTMWKPASAAEMIDKSGYLLRARREDLKRRAAKLKAEKAAKAYRATDDREKVEEIRGMIANMKKAIIKKLEAANSYDEVSAVHTMIDRYPDGLKWIVNSFETYEEKTTNKAYTSIEAANATYTKLKAALEQWQPAQLDSIGENMKAGFNRIAAAVTTTTATPAEA